MGDNGKMYVPESLREIYKKEIVPLADVLTPNQFEFELLTDKKINSIKELQDTVTELHKMGPKVIAVSSTEINDKLTALVSTMKDNKFLKMDIPTIPASFTGSGDLFAALFLAHMYLQDDIKVAIEKTINSLHSVLLNTYEHAQAYDEKQAQNAKKIELRLIQSKNCIENPEIRLLAQSL